MRPKQIFVVTSALLPVLFGTALAQQAREDQPSIIAGVETVCTGTTDDVRADPRWQSYALKIEFVGADGQYLGNEKVTVTGGDRTVAVQCDGPWVLMRLPAGTYTVTADVAQAGHQNVTARVPASGQALVIVRFPAAGGETTKTPAQPQ